MTYIEYMNQLWRSALLSPLPASEIALFAYLVNESNKRYWKMPFACSTTRICEDLRLSRQTVITARKHLAERKLIAFTEGKSRHLPSNYTLLEWTNDLTVGLTDPLKDFSQAWIGMVVATIGENVSHTGQSSLLPMRLFIPNPSFRTSFRSLITCRVAQTHTFHSVVPMVVLTSSLIGTEHRSWD
jgi:hypothetical protein